jgi:hypothetical protein
MDSENGVFPRRLQLPRIFYTGSTVSEKTNLLGDSVNRPSSVCAGLLRVAYGDAERCWRKEDACPTIKTTRALTCPHP